MPVVGRPAHPLHRAVEISREEATSRRIVDGESAELGWRVAGSRCILAARSHGAAVARCLWRADLISIDREQPPRSVLIGIGDVNVAAALEIGMDVRILPALQKQSIAVGMPGRSRIRTPIAGDGPRRRPPA